MQLRYGLARRIWVMDRGMVHEENRTYLRKRGGQYIVGTPMAMLRSYEQAMVEKGWTEVEEGVEVKLSSGPDG